MSKGISMENEYHVERAKFFILERESKPLVFGNRLYSEFDDWINFVIKDSHGFSITRFWGYSTRISDGPQSDSERIRILSEIVENNLTFSKNERINLSQRFIPKWKSHFTDLQYLVGKGTYTDFGGRRGRINNALKFISKKSYHPWGYYAYDILNKDRFHILHKYGISVGLIPVINRTNLKGVFKCDVVNLFANDTSFCDSCEKTLIMPDSDGYYCYRCNQRIIQFNVGDSSHESYILSDEEFIIESNNSKDRGDKTLTNKETKELKKFLATFGPVIPVSIKDHLGPVRADADEMSGIGGDHNKRYGLGPEEE